MGQMKRFAAWLSNCVCQSQMSDEDVIEVVKSLSCDEISEVDSVWLSEQISLVRKYPHFYRVFSG
jgi:hypothetical protein